MTDDNALLAGAPRLDRRLGELAGLRLVFFAGLPATGKSLLANLLAHRARSMGREVRLLQWDVARPVFEASEAGRRYPLVDGVTQPLIRRAVGLWARSAVGAWPAGEGRILIGETPLIGWRLVELVRFEDDAAEALLASVACRFVLVVPSNAVRGHIEAERRRRALAPVNPHELEDAPPHVLDATWRELIEAGRRLRLVSDAEAASTDAYDAEIYRRVYERLLRHRRLEVLALDDVLPTAGVSAYDFAFEPSYLVPTAEETGRFIREAEAEMARGGFDMSRWWGA